MFTNFKKITSIVLSGMLLFTSLPFQSFAALIPTAPAVVKTLTGGQYNLTITDGNQNPQNDILLYRLSDNDPWLGSFNYTTMADGNYNLQFRYVTGDVANPTDASNITPFAILNENAEVAAIDTVLTNLLNLTLDVNNIISTENQLTGIQTNVNGVADTQQKAYLQQKLDTLTTKVITFKSGNSLLIINNQINNLSTVSLSKYTVDDILTQISKLDSSTYRLDSFTRLTDKMKLVGEYSSNRLQSIESELNSSFKDFNTQSIGVAKIDKYRLGYTSDGTIVIYSILKDYDSSSSTWNQVYLGEYEEWIEGVIIDYVRNSIPTISGKQIEFRLFGSDYKEMKKILYNNETLTNGYTVISNTKKTLQDNFDYLTFKTRLFTTGTAVDIVLTGDFDITDSVWTNRDVNRFSDFITYDIGQNVMVSLNKDVNITVVDKDNAILTTKNLTKSSMLSTDSRYSTLRSNLNSNYYRYNGNLEFNYEITGSSQTVTVRMIGTNFRETYDEWKNIDSKAFENWVLNDVGKTIVGETASNVKIRLYDKANTLLKEYTLNKTDFVADYATLEKELNTKYYKYQTIYMDFILLKDSSSNTLNVKVDALSSESKWRDINKSDFDYYMKNTIGKYVIEKIPRDLTISVKDKNGYSLSSYTLYKNDYGTVLEKSNYYKTNYGTFGSLTFNYEIKNDSTITVYANGSNFSKYDDIYKNTSESQLLSFFETNIVNDLIKVYNKDVKLYIYDKNNYSIKYEYYNKNYLDTKNLTVINDTRSYLNNNMAYIENGIKVSFDLVRDTTIVSPLSYTLKPSGSFTSSDWSKLSSNEVSQYFRIVGIKALEKMKMSSLKVEIPYSNAYIEMKTITDKDTIFMTTKSNLFYKNDSSYKVLDKGFFASGISLGYGLVNNLVNEYKSDITNKTLVVEAPSEYRFTISKKSLELLNKTNTDILIANQNHMYLIDSAQYNATFLKDFITINVTPTTKKTYGTKIVSGISFTSNIETYNSTNDKIRLNSELNNNSFIQILIPYTFSFSDSSFGGYSLEYDIVKDSINDSYRKIYKMNNPGYGEFGLLYDNTIKTFNDMDSIKNLNEVMILTNKKILSGKPNGDFDPNGKVTRAEFVTMMVKGLKLSSKGTKSFKDMKNNKAWFYNSVMIAASNNLISGDTSGKFNPNSNITKEEMMVILDKANTLLGKSFDSSSVLTSSDDESIRSWAKQPIINMKATGVISNTEDAFSPKSTPTREETAKYIYNLMDFNNILK